LAKEKIRLARFLYASMAAQVYMNFVPGAACHSTARLMTGALEVFRSRRRHFFNPSLIVPVFSEPNGFKFIVTVGFKTPRLRKAIFIARSANRQFEDTLREAQLQRFSDKE
jgi:hypothetical protein